MKNAKAHSVIAAVFCLLLTALLASCGGLPPSAPTGGSEATEAVTAGTERTGASTEKTDSAEHTEGTTAWTTAWTTATVEVTASTEGTEASTEAITEATTEMSTETETETAVEGTKKTSSEGQSTLEFVPMGTVAYGVEYEYDESLFDDDERIVRRGQEGTVYHIFSVSQTGEREFISAVETPPVDAVICRGTRPAYEVSEQTLRSDVTPFALRLTYDSTLPEGERRTVSLGREGYTEATVRVTYYHGQEIGRETVARRVVLPEDEVVMIGTKKAQETFGMPYIDAAHGGEDYAVTQYFGGSNSHGGIDFGVWYGREIVSVLSGTVIAAYDEGDFGRDDLRWTYGTYVTVEHDNGMRSTYAHLRDRTVSVGDRVEKGQTLGHSGNTGRVSPAPTASNPLAGTHLHFELRILEGGSYQKTDPTWYLPRWDQ